MSLQRALRFAGAVVALLALSVLLFNFRFPLTFRIALAAFALFAALRPMDALLAAAAVGPFAGTLASLLGSPPFRAYESVMLAFLAGWLVHPPPAARGAAGRRALPPAGAMIALVVASVITLGLQLHAADAAFFARTMGDLREAYLWTADMTGVIEGANIIVGILILLAVVELTEREPGRIFVLIEVLAIAAAVATGLSVLLAFGIGAPAALARQEAFGKARYSATIADVNAAGSYFVLILGLAGGMAASTTGRRQWWWLGAMVTVLIGLGLCGSRSALVAALAAAAAIALWLAVSRGLKLGSSIPMAGWAMALLLAGVAVATFIQSPLLSGSDMRRDFTIASWRMIQARPAFGIGMGRYYTVSRLVLPPWLAALYGQENAHDYFLQTAAELGLAGLAALLWLFGAALQPSARALRDRSRDYVTAGLTAGVLAYLVTCASGHPLLQQESGFPFWMMLGLALVTSARPLSSSAGVAQAFRPAAGGPAVSTFVAAALACVVFASIPFRLTPPRVRLHEEQDGFGPWQTDQEGRKFRESAEASSLFVGPDVTALELPIRRVPGLLGHRLSVVDQEPFWSMHNTPVGDSWSSVKITLPGADPLMPYQRINLGVVDDGGVPPNPRASGVAVGEINITAVRE